MNNPVLRTLNLVTDMATTGLESIKQQGCQKEYFFMMVIIFKVLQRHTYKFSLTRQEGCHNRPYLYSSFLRQLVDVSVF